MNNFLSLRVLYFLVIAIYLFSCNMQPSSAPNDIETPLIFEEAFFPGTQFWINKEPVFFRVVHLGDINLHSGQLVAGDPSIEHQRPYTEQFPPGIHPVQLAIAQTANRHFNALLKIHFSDNDTEYWRMALRPGQRLNHLKPQEFYGLIINSERLMIMDFKEYNSLESKIQSHKDFVNQIDKKLDLAKAYSNIELNFKNPEQNSEVVVVVPGTGNGIYAAYIGFDAQRKPTNFLIDFYVVPWADP